MNLPRKNLNADWLGVPRMSIVVSQLAESLAIETACRVVSIARREDGWTLVDERGRNYGFFDALLMTAPPEQAADLLAGVPELADRLRAIEMEPLLGRTLHL